MNRFVLENTDCWMITKDDDCIVMIDKDMGESVEITDKQAQIVFLTAHLDRVNNRTNPKRRYFRHTWNSVLSSLWYVVIPSVEHTKMEGWA